jgi:hypothetical protein
MQVRRLLGVDSYCTRLVQQKQAKQQAVSVCGGKPCCTRNGSDNTFADANRRSSSTSSSSSLDTLFPAEFPVLPATVAWGHMLQGEGVVSFPHGQEHRGPRKGSIAERQPGIGAPARHSSTQPSMMK